MSVSHAGLGRRMATALAAGLLMLAVAPPAHAANQLEFDWSEDWFSNVRVGATATGTYKIFSYPGPDTVTDVEVIDSSNTLTVDATGCVGHTVNYQACYFEVTFSPTVAGTYPFQLTASSATNSTTQEFTAIARDPFVGLATWDSLDWGTVEVGTTNSQWLWINNTGNVPADVSVSITGDDAAAFSGPESVHIDSSTYLFGQEWVEFTFMPAHEGDSSALVTWTAGDAVATTTLHGLAYDVANDNPESAIEITGPYPYQHTDYLPFATTSDAERDACPQQINAVWYRFTAAEDTALLYMFGSNNPDVPVVATLDGVCDIPMYRRDAVRARDGGPVGAVLHRGPRRLRHRRGGDLLRRPPAAPRRCHGRQQGDGGSEWHRASLGHRVHG